MEPFIPCRKCVKKEHPQNMPGFFYITLPGGGKGLQECDCHKEWVEKNIIRIRASKSNLWTSDFAFQYTEKNYVGEKSFLNVLKLKKYIEGFEKKDPKFLNTVLYLYGPHGTQKTTLAQWVGLSLLKRGYKVYYTLMQSLILLLSPDFNDKENEKKKYREMLLQTDCLIIDEAFQKEKITLYKSGYQLPILESFLRERIDIQRKSTLFVSNVSPEEINNNHFGISIQDFIERNTTHKGTALLFEDKYAAIKAQFDITSIFED